MDILFATWCLSDNFGDKLTPFIVEKISGKKCIFSPPESEFLKYMVTGSILNWDARNAIVWGCGVASTTDTVPVKARILATRGPISKSKAIVSGTSSNIAIGDPALLLPRFYKPKISSGYRIGILPHYVDLDITHYRFGGYLPEDVIIINPLDDVESVINLICSCKSIISSSLHGLITAEAYGIPTAWTKFSDRLLGDKTKFIDHYMAIGSTNLEPIDHSFTENVNALLETPVTKKMLNIDLNYLYEVCPFK